jgi:DNA-binding LacI/PurR family transcriptional regulator
LGQLAARKLIQMINEPDLPPERAIVYGKMIEGKTVKKIG